MLWNARILALFPVLNTLAHNSKPFQMLHNNQQCRSVLRFFFHLSSTTKYMDTNIKHKERYSCLDNKGMKPCQDLESLSVNHYWEVSGNSIWKRKGLLCWIANIWALFFLFIFGTAVFTISFAKLHLMIIFWQPAVKTCYKTTKLLTVKCNDN